MIFTFKEKFPVTLLPLQPVLTGQHVWLTAVKYYGNNLMFSTFCAIDWLRSI